MGIPVVGGVLFPQDGSARDGAGFEGGELASLEIQRGATGRTRHRCRLQPEFHGSQASLIGDRQRRDALVG